MAINSWDKGLREENESLKQQLMISASPNPGPAPVRPEDIPIAPSSPYEKGKSPHKLAGILYPTRWPKNDPNAGKEPFDNKGNDLSVPVPNHPDWAGNSLKIAHGEGRGPQPKYHDEYNQPLKFPPWMHINPSGEQIEIPWQKEDYLKEHPNLKISGATSRQIRDKLKPYTRGGPADYDKEGGSLRDLPASLRIKLLKA